MNLNIELPVEFVRLCKRDGIPPEIVIRGFIADLAGITAMDGRIVDGYISNGSDERDLARAYYRRGYPTRLIKG